MVSGICFSKLQLPFFPPLQKTQKTQDWQTLVSAEAGGWVQKRSSHSFLLRMFGNVHNKKLKQEKFQASTGRVEPNPGQRWEFCCTKSREPVTKDHAMRQESISRQSHAAPQRSSSLKLAGPVLGAPDIAGVPCHSSGVKAKP